MMVESRHPNSLDDASLRHRAESGDREAQFELATRLHDGTHGTNKDYSEALSWFAKAAEQGSACAYLWLGYMHEHGEGVPRDYGQAHHWYRKGAEEFRKTADLGDASAQYELGILYTVARGVPQDYSQALSLFRRAAEQGNAKAQTQLGVMCHDGLGVSTNYAEALMWFQRAAEQGFAEAQIWLGHMYERGEGVPRDDGQARLWFQKAADQGDEDAKGRLSWMDTLKRTKEITEEAKKVTERIKELKARLFGVDSGEHSSSPDQHQNRVSENEAYELLGVTAACTDEELKAAYRQKVNCWHPDKFHSVQIPEEMKEMATRQMARINEAYDRLKSER